MPSETTINLSQFFYGNSLVNHYSDSSQTNVPYWLNQLISHNSGTYAVNGGYGFLQQFADRTSPANEWGFAGVDGLWDTDVNTFSEVTFDQVIITPANFIQDQAPGALYYNSAYSPLTATIDIITDTLVDQPTAEVFIYEGWSDLGLFSEAFPPSDAVMESYYAYNQAGYHDWYVGYSAALQAEFPEASITLIPVAPVLAGLLAADGPLAGLATTDVFVDTAPHGTDSLYFLAGLITYQATIGRPAPADFPIPDNIHSLIADNFAAVVEFVEAESALYLGSESVDNGLNMIIGTDEGNRILGSAEDDGIEGHDGNDTINAKDGDDVINGGGGKDDIIGANGNDTVDGGAGNDFIRGNLGDDSLIGGEGSDVIRAGDGNDTLEGGADRDKLQGDAGDDLIYAGEGRDRALGGDGQDTIFGEAGIDKIDGGNGNDHIDGGADADKIKGNAGDDTLIGGTGNDQLTGGAGNDVFVFATGSGKDQIKDFEDGHDLIDVRGFGFEFATQLAFGEFNVSIGAGQSYTIVSGNDSIKLKNTSGEDMQLTEADFIYEDVFIIG